MAGRFLVDTNVICLVVNGKSNRLKTQKEMDAAEWYESVTQGAVTMLSFASVAELKQWILSRKDPKDREKVRSAVSRIFHSSYFIHRNEDITEAWTLIRHEATVRGKFPDKNPKSSQINDIWIGATAHASKLTLLTYDSDFDWMKGIGVSVLRYKENTQNGLQSNHKNAGKG